MRKYLLTKTMNKKINYVLFIVTCFIFMGCSSDDESTKTSYDYFGESTGSFDVTFTDQTVYFDSTELKDIISIDTVAHIYRFRQASSKAQEIQKGKILLIYGKLLRKVEKVTISGNEIIVETVDATLNEAISDGTIEWESYCGFAPENLVGIEMGKKVYSPTFQSNDTASFEIELNNITYVISMKLNNSSAYVKLSASKKIADAINATFTAEGTVSAFSSYNKIRYSNSELMEYRNENRNLSGDLTLSLAAVASGTDNINYELPFVILQVPYMVGPIPVFIRVKLQFVVNAVVPNLAASANASIKFTYNGTQTGFVIDKENVVPKPQMKIGKYTISKNKAEVGAPSAIGVNFGIGFPRLELGIFDKVAVPWIQTAFLIGVDYTSFPACRQTKASYIGACGYNFTFLGFKHSGTKTLWQLDTIIDKFGNCK